MLERFSNKDYILSTKGFVRGITWKQEDVEQLQLSTQTVLTQERPVVELHLYSPSGMYITGGVTTAFDFDRDKISVDYATFFNTVDIERGYYEVVSNIYRNLLGSEVDPLIQVKEISADRREIIVRLVPLDPARLAVNGNAIPAYLTANDSVFDKDIFLNFGKDRLVKVINQRNYSESNTLENNTIAFRLYQPLPADIVISDTLWVIESLSDSITDNVNVTTVADDRVVNILRGPNFEYADELATTTETDFQNWNSLLGSNLSTSQQIIDRYFSGSLGGVQLNVDYTAFENFVFYSSAYERLANFKYKLELIEYYDSQLNTLNNVALGADDTALQNNIALTTERKDNVIGGFDGFERWLYSEPTASLTTHGISGSFIGADGYALTPWPKYLSGSKYYLYDTTDSISTLWYNGFSATASLYDEQNNNALVKTIPEHIRNDANNSEYELFINMIGHHFDILYTYVKALSDTYRPEENPKLGRSRETLYHIAESLGWKLTNGNQATALWKYKLGTEYNGTYQSTGSLFSKSNEDISTEVWRRIVNNLPYLLKTKGTSRSIKALMNAYGIPQTLLSIREYGGPSTTNETPALIEDRFAYAVRLTGESQIHAHMHHVSSSIGRPWGIERGVIPIMTHEIRFKPSVTQSMLLMSYAKDVAASIYVDDEYVDPFYVSSLSANGESLWHVILEHTASYSGSGNYGRVHFIMPDGGSTYTIDPLHAITPWTPIYDGDWWNFRLNYNTSGRHYNSGSNTDTLYQIKIQKKSDFVNAKVVHAVSASTITATSGSHYQFWCSPTASFNLLIGGNSGSTNNNDVYGLDAYVSTSLGLGSIPTMYKGNLQEYRAWLETVNDTAFNDHTINPTSYVSSISPSSSFDTLIRHFTLGTETKAYDLSTAAISIISSSHPYRGVSNFGSESLPFEITGSVRGFQTPANLQRGNFNAVEETYYIPGVSLGGNNFYSQKIRFDDNELVYNLSPIANGERSQYDLFPVDSNKLGMFYSMADQINKDIFNHVGRIELDDYIGDPDDEFEYTYPDLVSFAKQYWKKFSDRNDLNAYIRIFSQFDFSLFEQIKQLIPERADYVYGLLVEPHALERVKMPLYKGMSNARENNIDVVLQPSIVTSSGDFFPDYNATIIHPLSSSSDFISENKGSIVRPLSSSADFITEHLANIEYIVESDYCTVYTPPADERPSNTASLSDAYNKNSGASLPWSTTASSFFNALNESGSYYVFNSITPDETTSYLITRYNVNTQHDVHYNFRVQLWSSDANGSSTGSCTIELLTINEGGVSTLLDEYTIPRINYTGISYRSDEVYFENVLVNAYNDLFVAIKFNNLNAAADFIPTVDRISVTRTVNEVCHTGIFPFIDDCRPSYIYQKDIRYYSGSTTYSTRERRNTDHFLSQSLGLYYSSSVEHACYRDDFFTQVENLYYEGCRITAPDINVSVPLGGIGYGPVVTVWITNPNQLIYSLTPGSITPGGNTGTSGPIGGNTGPGPGNLQPGNLIIR
jgi:hypothetical protein